MEELFKNKTKCTQKEYDKFLQTQVKENALSEILYAIFNIVFFSACLIFAIISKEFKLALLLFIGILIYVWYKFIGPARMIKKERKSKKIIKEYINEYKFYKHYFTTQNPDGKAQTFYFKIYKVLETETHYYIYISKEYAFIVSKQGFINSTDEEFKKFIQNKVKIKYKIEKQAKLD